MAQYELRLLVREANKQEDEMLIEQALGAAPGVDGVEVDYHTHMVRVTTVNEDARDDVLKRLRDAGYDPEPAL